PPVRGVHTCRPEESYGHCRRVGRPTSRPCSGNWTTTWISRSSAAITSRRRRIRPTEGRHSGRHTHPPPHCCRSYATPASPYRSLMIFGARHVATCVHGG